MAMTNEEIDAEIKRLQSLKEQNNQVQSTESNKPATGIYNPADYINQITNKMNDAGYTDEKVIRNLMAMVISSLKTLT